MKMYLKQGPLAAQAKHLTSSKYDFTIYQNCVHKNLGLSLLTQHIASLTIKT